jgi:aspartyl-tRNA(Asn)/glutamyl-tRNA(Gln) amidotransferase subunit B
VIFPEFIEKIRSELPELPAAKKQRFMQQYALSDYDADLLTSRRDIAEFFETVVSLTKAPSKVAANWINGELSVALQEANQEIASSPITATQLAQLLDRLFDGTLSGKTAKTVFEALWQQGGEVDRIIAERGLMQISDSDELEEIIKGIVAANPEQSEQYRSGKEKVFAFFVGQVMRATQGKANPNKVNELLKKHLS